jgi:hypothetical protein
VKPDAATSWADRRVEILQRACHLIFEQLKNGTSLNRACESAARKFHNSDLGNGHSLQLSRRQMLRHWRKWQDRPDASSLQLKHPVKPRSVAVNNPGLLHSIAEYCLQNGTSLSRAVEVFRRRGAPISVSRICRALNAPAFARFARSHRNLPKRRKKLEERFLRSVRRANREFLKKRDALSRGVLQLDLKLQRRLLLRRDILQRKFFAADARAVKRHEELQLKPLRDI